MGYKLMNMIGRSFGRLTVLSRLPSVQYGMSRKRRWVCLCECGNKTEADTGALTSGNKKSCGCLHSEAAAQNGAKSRALVARPDAPLNVVISIYKGNAKKRSLEWLISKDQAEKLFSGNCHYCGLPPSNRYKTSYHYRLYSGIDRRDNSLGYTPENSVSCCKVCNHAKHTMDEKTFINWLSRVFSHQENCRRAIAEIDKQSATVPHEEDRE